MSSTTSKTSINNDMGIECAKPNNTTDNINAEVSESSPVLSKCKQDSTDSDINSDSGKEVNEKSEINTDGLLTSNCELNANVDEVSNMPKFQIIKNLCILCTSFFLLFTSFASLSNLQSSINKEEGIGTFSLVIVYIAMMVSSMFLSSVSIDRFGRKLTMCIAMIMYVIYMAANLYPVWGTMIPAALLCGLAAGPLWASQSSYVSELSKCYAKTTNLKPKDSLSYFFGIFYMCVNASKISGNLIAAVVLKQDEERNASMTLKEIKDCVANKQEAVDNATTLKRPDDITIYSICGIWIGLAIVGIIILAFIAPVTVDKDVARKRKPIYSHFLSTAKHFWNSKLQKLMVPITLYYGLSTGFLTADFTKSLVGCTLGIRVVGDVMLCHGLCNTISSVLIGRLVKNTGQLPFFTITFLFYGGVQIFLITWKPGPDYDYLFFMFAGMWGVADAIIKTQVLAMYGYLFKDNTETAFGSYFVSEATGYIISFSYSTFASTNIKLYILLGLLLCCATSYYIVVYIDRKQKALHKKAQQSGSLTFAEQS